MSGYKQKCLFCSNKGENLSVYSVGLGRLGICIDCAINAVKELNRHSMQRELDATFSELEGLRLHKQAFGLNDEDQERLRVLQIRVQEYKNQEASKILTQIF